MKEDDCVKQTDLEANLTRFFHLLHLGSRADASVAPSTWWRIKELTHVFRMNKV